MRRLRQSDPAHLMSCLNQLRQDGEFCDVQLCCRNGRLAAHTLVLAAHSSLFRSFSGGDSVLEVILADANIKQVRQFLTRRRVAKKKRQFNFMKCCKGENLSEVLGLKMHAKLIVKAGYKAKNRILKIYCASRRLHNISRKIILNM